MEITKQEKELRLEFAKAIIEHLYQIKVDSENEHLKFDLKNKLIKNFSWKNTPLIIKELKDLHVLSKELNEKEYQEFILTVIDSFNTISMTIEEKIASKKPRFNDNTKNIRNHLSVLEESMNNKELSIEELKSKILTFTFNLTNQLEDIDEKNEKIDSQNDTLVESLQSELDKMRVAFTKLNQELQESIESSKIDALTGIKNRNGYEEAIQRLDSITEISLIVCDIDNFKKLNDTYGHSAGDGALKCISDIIKNNFKNDEEVFRYGGEEFVIILPNTSLEKAYYKAETIRRIIEKTSFFYKDEKVKITCSFGVANKKHPKESLKDVFIQSDKLLYESKKTGRNKVSL